MDNTKLNTVAEATLTGTAKNSRRGNIRLRSSSVEHAPMTRLPPDENGEIAELWAPTTIQVYKINGFRPDTSESPGTSGNNAGQTTPNVLEKKLIIAPIRLNATGMIQAGRLLPAHAAICSKVPAFTAT